MPARGCFITGTDTDIGKTSICLALVEVLKKNSYRVAAMKPVASGCEESVDGRRNKDALLMLQHTGSCHDYRTINPFALSLPSAPLLAAQHDGVEIEAGPILESFHILSENADVVLVEGVGGWHMQLNEDLWLSEVVKNLNLPVIMVVGLRLGCINHALLTAEAIAGSGCWMLGWIGNQIDPSYKDSDSTIALLSRLLAAPLIGSIPYVPQGNVEKMTGFLDNICGPDLGLVDKL